MLSVREEVKSIETMGLLKKSIGSIKTSFGLLNWRELRVWVFYCFKVGRRKFKERMVESCLKIQ